MNSINLCYDKDNKTEFPNGKRTLKQIKEYQKKYREAHKKKKEFMFEIINETCISSTINQSR